MSDIYVDIQTLNYRGEASLSGYTLPGCNFTFIPNLDEVDIVVSSKQVLWDFGDGTTSDGLTGVHNYKFPGVYGVRLIVYNRQGEAIVGSYIPGLTAHDFIYDNLINDAPSTFEVKAGHFESFDILRQSSWRTVPANNSSDYTVNLYVSGTLDPFINIDSYNSSQWSHLIQNSKFLEKVVAGYSYEYIPITSITTTSTLIYVNQNAAGEYIQCLSTDTDAVIAGSTGYATPYFTSDKPKNYLSSGSSPVIIFTTLDNRKIVDDITLDRDLSNFTGTNYFNSSPAVIADTRIRYNPATKLSLSTNGIDTQGDAILSTFNIPAISWQNTKIPFIVKLEDNDNFSTKFYPTLTAGTFGSDYIISLSAIAGNAILPGTFYSDFTSAAPTDVGGYFRGYFVPSATAVNVKIVANTRVNDPFYYSVSGFNVSAIVRTVTGESNLFDIFPFSGKYGIAKVNEGFDFGNFLGNQRYAEYQYDSKYFDNFLLLLSAGLGHGSSKPYEFGKTVYEKIANFIDNNSNIDTANVQGLVSMSNQVGHLLEPVNYEYPPQVRRVVDILSINHKGLFGSINTFNSDFNRRNSTSSSFAVNIGTELNILSSTFPVSAGIVVYEKFSGANRLVYTAKLSGIDLTDILQLSTFNSTWGWAIPVPTPITGAQIGDYFKFYTYIPTSEGSIKNSVIDWSDSTTTLSFYTSSYVDWSKDDGIMDNIINYELTKGLRLFSSATDITYNN